MCRYINPKLEAIESREELISFTCQEDPRYKAGLESNCKHAFKAVSAYINSKEVEEAASLLYQVR